jgi:hypothetical protein
MPDRILRTPEGQAVVVPEAELASALAAGYTPELPEQAAQRTADETIKEQYSGFSSKAKAATAGFLRGATLGLSDVGYRLANGEEGIERLKRAQDANPTITTGFEIAGAIAPALLSGGGGAAGSIARLSPTGATAALGARIAGTEAGIARAVVAGVVEGGAQSAGMYVSDVALGNKPLSAEGFLAETGKGALFGGGLAGGLAVSERAFISAKKLFPKQEVTREAAEAAERTAVDTIDAAVLDGETMQTAAQQQIDAMVAQRAATDADFGARINAARAAEAEAKAAAAQSRAQLAQERLAKAQAPKPTRKSRKAFQSDTPATPTYESVGDQVVDATIPPEALADRIELPGVGADAVKADKARRVVEGGLRTDVPDPIRLAVRPDGRFEVIDGRHRIAAAIDQGKPIRAKVERGIAPRTADEGVAVATPPNDLEAMLGQSVARLEAGETIGDLTAAARRGPQAAVEDAIAAADPQAAKLVDTVRAERMTREEVKNWIAGLRKQADDKMSRAVASGKVSRDRDVITEVAGDASPPVEGQGFESYLVRRGRERTTKLRNPYTNDELIAKAKANPNFFDMGDVQHGAPAGMGARNDLAERILSGKSTPDKVMIEELVDEGGKLRSVRRPATGDDILGAVQRQKPELADQIAAALKIKPAGADLAADMAPAIQILGRWEAASADLAEALGDLAPMGARQYATELRAIQGGQGERLAAATANAADEAARKFAPQAAKTARERIKTARGEMQELQAADLEAKVAAKRASKATETIAPGAAPVKEGGALGKLADLGAAVEVLQTLGIAGVPDPDKLPVIGPILGIYLKARAAGAIYRRLGGRLPATAETTIASKAASARQRINAAVGRMLDTGATVSRGARKAAPSVAAQLSHRLFDDGDESPAPRRRASEAKPGGHAPDLLELWQARSEELARASEPGAVRRAVGRLVRAGDPEIVDAIASAQERKLQFLDEHRPRPPGLPTIMKGGRSDWAPSRGQLAEFAQLVEAADDPVGVLERAADGGDVTPDQAAAIRHIYPELFAEAQIALLEKASVLEATLPYRRRVALSVLFDVPLDGTLEPSYVAFLQESYAASPPAEPANAAQQAAAPPVPTVAGQIALASRVGTDLDQRAAGGM